MHSHRKNLASLYLVGNKIRSTYFIHQRQWSVISTKKIIVIRLKPFIFSTANLQYRKISSVTVATLQMLQQQSRFMSLFISQHVRSLLEPYLILWWKSDNVDATIWLLFSRDQTTKLRISILSNLLRLSFLVLQSHINSIFNSPKSSEVEKTSHHDL